MGCGPAEQRLLLTGLHSVADIFCQSCKTTLGWKYVSAPLPRCGRCLGHPNPYCGHHPGHPEPTLWALPQAPQIPGLGTPNL